MANLSSTTVRIALIDYRADLIRMQCKYPARFNTKEVDDAIKSIDEALMEIEGNITTVSITPATCRM